MSLLHADLPSDDEADDDYDPSRDDKADEDGQTKAKGKNTGTKRRRGSAAYPGAPEAETPDAELNENDVAVETPASLAKKGKVDQLWAQLNKGKQVAQPAKTLLPSTIAEEAQTQSLVQPPLSKQPFSLASICRPVQKAQKAGSDTVSFGLLNMHALCYGSTLTVHITSGLETPAWDQNTAGRGSCETGVRTCRLVLSITASDAGLTQSKCSTSLMISLYDCRKANNVRLQQQLQQQQHKTRQGPKQSQKLGALQERILRCDLHALFYLRLSLSCLQGLECVKCASTALRLLLIIMCFACQMAALHRFD